MLQQFLAVSLLGMVAIGRCHADDKVKKALADLEGTWKLVKMEINGKSLLQKNEKTKLIIKNGKVTSEAKNAPEKEIKLSKILEPSKKPKTVTLPYEGKLRAFGKKGVRPPKTKGSDPFFSQRSYVLRHLRGKRGRTARLWRRSRYRQREESRRPTSEEIRQHEGLAARLQAPEKMSGADKATRPLMR